MNKKYNKNNVNIIENTNQTPNQNIINLRKLPLEIVIHHIIPYTYEQQPKILLLDIKSYCNDYQLLQLLLLSFNQLTILNYLIRFCNDNIAPIYDVEPKYENTIRRHISFSDKSKLEIKKFVYSYYHRRMLTNTRRKLRFLWGLLLPIERTIFLEQTVFT